MKDICAYEQDLQVIESIQRNIDIITAVLLLSGQFTIVRLIIDPGGFALSVGGH
ncbi:hypothetical protein NDK43_16060 [Neobacillus pocheonensis]|uniref:Uncharacterized protein n=1 Tax=Neobacillus pocheonensis TaxID=363869 RepID=A0ABT0WBD7_9BACI|nr:hypothetical protein [Neobacillus pocheonensis]